MSTSNHATIARSSQTADDSSSTRLPTTPSQQGLTLDTIHMLTTTTGWATGSTPAANMPSIFRTTDGGIHWQAVLSPEISSATIAATYFLDPKNAWGMVSDKSSPPTMLTIYHTVDGGQNWEKSTTSISSDSSAFLDFVDPQHGWFMVSLDTADSSEAVEIFKTVDGGTSWVSVSRTADTADQATPGSLPYRCEKTGITLLDATTGWVTGSCPGNTLFFYVTHDGGQTWQSQTLTPPRQYEADIFANCQCAVSAPIFVTPQDGFITVQIFNQAPRTYLYMTDDGGITWTLKRLPVRQLDSRPTFIDPFNGWVVKGRQLYLTHDGGRNWITHSRLPISDADMRGGLNFVDKDDGWVTDGEHLYVTHDSGYGWLPVLFTTQANSNS